MEPVLCPKRWDHKISNAEPFVICIVLLNFDAVCLIVRVMTYLLRSRISDKREYSFSTPHAPLPSQGARFMVI